MARFFVVQVALVVVAVATVGCVADNNGNGVGDSMDALRAVECSVVGDKAGTFAQGACGGNGGASTVETVKANAGLVVDSNGAQCLPQQRVVTYYTDARGLNTSAYVCKTIAEVETCSQWAHSLVGNIHVATCVSNVAAK